MRTVLYEMRSPVQRSRVAYLGTRRHPSNFSTLKEPFLVEENGQGCETLDRLLFVLPTSKTVPSYATRINKIFVCRPPLAHTCLRHCRPPTRDGNRSQMDFNGHRSFLSFSFCHSNDKQIACVCRKSAAPRSILPDRPKRQTVVGLREYVYERSST